MPIEKDPFEESMKNVNDVERNTRERFEVVFRETNEGAYLDAHNKGLETGLKRVVVMQDFLKGSIDNLVISDGNRKYYQLAVSRR